MLVETRKLGLNEYDFKKSNLLVYNLIFMKPKYSASTLWKGIHYSFIHAKVWDFLNFDNRVS